MTEVLTKILNFPNVVYVNNESGYKSISVKVEKLKQG